MGGGGRGKHGVGVTAEAKLDGKWEFERHEMVSFETNIRQLDKGQP